MLSRKRPCMLDCLLALLSVLSHECACSTCWLAAAWRSHRHPRKSNMALVLTVQDVPVPWPADAQPTSGQQAPQLTSHAGQQQEQTPKRHWSKHVLPVLAGVLALPVLLLIAMLALLLAALWLGTGAHAAARAILLRNGTLEPSKRTPRGLLHTAAVVYASWYAVLLTIAWKVFLRHLIRPKFVFLVYGEDEVLMTKMFSDVCYHALGLAALPLPEVCPIGLIISHAGLGMCASMLPCLQDLDEHQTMQIPARLRMAFPHTRTFALAGRLPGVLARLNAPPLQSPFVDGVHGTLFTMLAAAEALQKCVDRPLHNTTICILGGSGFIGSKLVDKLSKQQQDTAASEQPQRLHHGQQAQPPAGPPAEAAFTQQEQQQPTEPELQGQQGRKEQPQPLQSSGYRLVISMDPRNTCRQHINGVLYTSEPSDITAADVVLVITAHGNECAAYLPHAHRGQVWGDDTHPEMGRRVVEGLRSKGVMLYKVFNTDGVGAHFVPSLPGFPARSIPGCLLMALVQAKCGVEVGRQSFEEFQAAALQLGFSAALGKHHPWFE